MKNLKTVKNKAVKIFLKFQEKQKEFSTFENSIEKELFKIYEKSKAIKEFSSKVENLEGGEYCFNQYGDLEYYLDIPEDILALPKITEYFEQASLWAGSVIDEKAYVNLMPPITVNWNHTNREYFVHDAETRKPVLDSSKGISEKALEFHLEKYQRDQGIFGDIVYIDYYGDYKGHFKSTLELGKLDDKEFKKAYDAFFSQYDSEAV